MKISFDKEATQKNSRKCNTVLMEGKNEVNQPDQENL